MFYSIVGSQQRRNTPGANRICRAGNRRHRAKRAKRKYTVMETRMVAITIPVTMQRSKWITVPRNISIPRPMIEKRVVRKMVPKVIQVEEVYEIECGITEMKQFFVGADTSNDGMLSYAEWQAANAGQGYDNATMKQMFASRDADGDGQISMQEMMAFQGTGGFIPAQGAGGVVSSPPSTGNRSPSRSPASGPQSYI